MPPRDYDARAEGQRRRLITLLEALADAVDADVRTDAEQCPRCGQYFARLSAHRDHCDGPTTYDE
jgi:hypothetical protein